MNAKILSLLSTPQARRWFYTILVMVFVGVSVQYIIKIACSERDNRSAFLRWRNQILALDDGVNIYDKHNYPNPPIMAIILEPLASLPPFVGSLLWFYLKVGMAFLVFHWVFRLLENPEKPFPFWGKAITIVLGLRPILSDLSHGNVNIFILFLVIGALYAYRNKQDYIAGLVLALSIACKVTPALFIPYFLWKRAWKTLIGCASGLLLFLFVIPGIYLGLEQNSFLLGQWMEQMIFPYVFEGVVTTEHQNQSLPGLLYRMFTDGPSFSVYNGTTYVPVEYHTLVNLNPVYLQWFIKLCMVIFSGLIIGFCRTPRDDRSNWRYCAEYSLILMGMLIFSERTWKHHCVSFLVPFAVMLYCLSAMHLSKGFRRYLTWSIILALVFITSTSTGAFGKSITRLAKLAQVYGAFLWANLVLVTAMFMILRNKSLVQSPASDGPDVEHWRVKLGDRGSSSMENPETADPGKLATESHS